MQVITTSFSHKTGKITAKSFNYKGELVKASLNQSVSHINAFEAHIAAAQMILDQQGISAELIRGDSPNGYTFVPVLKNKEIPCFVWAHSEGKPPRDGSGIKKTVKLYQIVEGKPVCVTTETDTFVSPEQLAMTALEKSGLVDSAAFKINENHGGREYALWQLEELGFCKITHL